MSAEIINLIAIMTIFVVIILFLIAIGSFWDTSELTDCSYCKEKLTSCKIIVTNEYGTRVYCDPHCVCNGLKDEEITKGNI